MNRRQAEVIRLLNADLRRELYEGSALNGKIGSGKYWVTHTASEQYKPLSRNDIDDLLTAGVIRQKWPDCDGFFILVRPPPNAA